MSERRVGPAVLLLLLAFSGVARSTLAQEPPASPPERVDVLVYGATPGGIATALAAAKHGRSVALVEPTSRIGGMLTCGLSYSDFRSFEALGGAFHDFNKRVLRYYREKYGDDSEQVAGCLRGTQGEPRVNLLILRSMLAERPSVTVLTERTLTGVATGAFALGRRPLESATFRGRDGVRTIRATVFVDATYEGDLIAAAGEPYHVGRESRKQYGESLAGDEAGEADGQVQAYNFRLIMTDDPANRVLPAAPPGYRRDDFAPVLALFESGKVKRVFDEGHAGIYRRHLPPMANRKVDVNDTPKAAARLSMPDVNDAYPDADEATRREIFERHVYYNIGLLNFLQNDEAVPARLKDDARTWGLCRDEFEESGHLPPQLYIREARRLVGQYVYTENDTELAPRDARAKLHPDSIAISDYIHNCHGTGRVGTRFDGKHTGEFYKFVPPSQIPYGVIVAAKTTNLLAPVPVSASHVGFSMLRYEPVWSSLGQAAGHAAHLAIERGTSVQKVSVGELQELLHADGAITLYTPDVPPESPHFAAVQWLGLRGFFHGLHDTKGEPVAKPKPIWGQYCEKFLFHDVEWDKPLDAELEARWRRLAESHGLKAPAAGSLVGKPRGETLRAIYESRGTVADGR